MVVTQSGFHKGFLTPDQLMIVGLDDQPDSLGKPSAEAALHSQLYRLVPQAGAIWHVHSPYATLVSRVLGPGVLELREYELLKAFDGITTHDVAVSVPIIANSQDMDRNPASRRGTSSGAAMRLRLSHPGSRHVCLGSKRPNSQSSSRSDGNIIALRMGAAHRFWQQVIQQELMKQVANRL